MSGYAVSDALGAINRWGFCSNGMELLQASQPGEVAALCSGEIQSVLNTAAQRGDPAPYRIDTETLELVPTE